MATLPYPDKLAGKRVLVFGGTSGIGFSVAALAVAANAIVHVSSSSQEKVNNAVSRIQSGYPSQAANITGSTCDLANEGTLESNLRALLESVTKEGPLDHVAFTAGDGLMLMHISEVDIKVLQQARTVRFFAPVLLAKLLTNPPFFKQSATSSLTLTSGTNGLKPVRNFAVPAAYCGATDYLTRSLSVDMAPVRVNAVSPGAVATEIFDAYGGSEGALADKFRKQSLTNSLGKPEDIAEAYLYIMRDIGIVGKVIESDSGRLLVTE